MAVPIAGSASLASTAFRAFGLTLWLILVAGIVRADAPTALTEPVVDRTGTLAPSEIAALRAKVDAIAARKGSQVAVLMVESTAPLSIEQYALAVAEATRLGRGGVDDGVLVLVAKDDRAVRIEVGRGLEGAIPDAIASRIIREYLGPKFRAGDFAGGLGDAVDALGWLIDGEPLPAPLDAHGAGDRAAELDFYLGAFLGAFVAAFLSGFGWPRAVRVPFAGVIGALLGGAALKSPVAVVSAGLAAIVFTIIHGGGAFRGGAIGPRGNVRGSGWSSIGTFGGGRGGGWSGGGGSFGGGGASGRW